MTRPTRRPILLAALLATLASAGTASAQQPAPPPAAPVVKMPVLKKDAGAQYPAQALRDGVREAVEVPLILEIDATGLVQRVSVETPVGHGFDEAATEAAARLEFSPATVDGVARAVKIRFKYRFPVPAAKLGGRVLREASDAPVPGAEVVLTSAAGVSVRVTTDAAGAWTSPELPAGKYTVTITAGGFKVQEGVEEVKPGEAASITSRLSRVPVARVGEPSAPGAAPSPGAPPAAGPIEEIQVRGVRPPREVTKRTIEQREMQRIPGTNGDALRSLQNLPGVARPPAIAGLLIVRGSAPQDTNVFVDGTLIPIVYHFGGLSSVVPTELLDRIDFYPGNFSAQYGRVMGGIVDVALRDPKTDGLHGLAQVDLIDARVLAEGPIGKSGWSFAVAGRRSWVDTWLKPVLKETGAGVTTAPVYYDYQALLNKELGKGSSLRLALYGSDDRLDILTTAVGAGGIGGNISTATGFWRLQARYKQRLSQDTDFKLMGSFGQDFIDFSIGDLFFKVTTYPVASRAELTHKVARGVTANVGMDFFYNPYDLTVRLPPIPRPGEPPAGPFGSNPPLDAKDTDALYRPALYTEFEVTPWQGARLVPGVRLDYTKETKEWTVGPRVTFRQDVQQSPRTTVKGGLGVFYQPPQPQEVNPVFGLSTVSSNRAYHYAFGLEREVTKQIEISTEAYYKQLDYLILSKVGNVSRGRTYGIEALLRYKPDARFFGWIAYTLSRSERQDTPEGPVRLSPFDQTHILTVLGSYRLGGGWEVGARFRLVSGNRYTPLTYGFFDENAGSYLALQSYPQFNSRLPMFNQLDIRLDKTWKLGKTAKLNAYLDVQNVYNQGNVEGVAYNFNNTARTFATGLPIIPSLGLRGEL